METTFIHPDEVSSRFRSKSYLWKRLSIDRRFISNQNKFSGHFSSFIQKMHSWLYEENSCWQKEVIILPNLNELIYDLLYRYLKNKQVIYFKIPCYPELEPKNVWPMIKDNNDLIAYFPDLKPSQLPEKEFLYGILCTLRPDGVRQLVATGVKSRSLAAEEDKDELIEVTVELKEAIMSLFSIKSK